MLAVSSMAADADKGLVDDRTKTSNNGPRQVTLIQGGPAGDRELLGPAID